MGLDQYVIRTKIKDLNRTKEIKNTMIWESENTIKEDLQFDNFYEDGEIDWLKQRFWYWRKHPNLHGWFEQKYREFGGTDSFNIGNHIQITLDMLDELEIDVKNKDLPYTTGFFFGEDENSDEEMDYDLEFIQKAREYLLENEENILIYTSSW